MATERIKCPLCHQGEITTRTIDWKPEGWVAIDAINNTWTEAVRRFEREIFPLGASPQRDVILSYFESIKYELYKRASLEKERNVKQRHNIREDPKQASPEPHQGRESAGDDSTSVNRERWKERTQFGRMHSMAGLGGENG